MSSKSPLVYIDLKLAKELKVLYTSLLVKKAISAGIGKTHRSWLEHVDDGTASRALRDIDMIDCACKENEHLGRFLVSKSDWSKLRLGTIRRDLLQL